MKKLSGLLLIPFLLLPTEALAGHRDHGSARGRVCYKEVWREEYVPGNRNRRGYVRRWQETKEIPCRRRRRPRHVPHQHHNTPDENSCIEGAILGGILGGGAGAAASRGDGRLWAIPLGIVGGTIIGCQVDGG